MGGESKCFLRFVPRRLAVKLRRRRTSDVRIAGAALGLLLFTLIAKAIGASREMAIAWRFGRGPEVDAYNLALTVSTWLPVTLNSVIAIVLVPALARMSRESLDHRTEFLRELNGVILLFGVLTGACAWVAAGPLIDFFAAGLPDATRQTGVEMVRWFAPLALLIVLSGVFIARLQAIHDHRYALFEALPALTVVVALLTWPTSDTLPLVVGTLIGFAWQTSWLFGRLRVGSAVSGLTLRVRSAHWPAVWRAALVLGAGQLAMSFVLPIDQWFAASIGSGVVATMGYANRIIALGMALGGAVISRATLPIFAEGIAQGGAEEMRRHALRWAWLMLFVGLAGTVLMWLFARPVVSALFERGAFSTEDTQAVAMALRWGIWQVPPYLAGLVLVAFLAAQRRFLVIAAVASVNVLVKAVGNFFLTERLGLNGILLTTVTMYCLSAMCCWLVLTYGKWREGEVVQ